MRRRLVAAALLVAALLAPASAVQAAPLYALSVASSENVVYPVVDGHIDSTTISGSIASASTDRVRATVVVTVGTRVAKTWILSTTGPFSFAWNGKIGSAVVGGTYVVTLRVAGETPVSDSFVVSPKKVTKLTWKKVTTLEGLGFDCYDNNGYDFTDPRWGTWLRKVCPLNFATDRTYRATNSNGTLYVSHVLTMPSAARNSLGPVSATVAANFQQYGAGSNSMWVCSDTGDPCDSGSVRTWSGSATKSASAALVSPPASIGMTDVQWWLRLQKGHDLRITGYTVTVTYYGLR